MDRVGLDSSAIIYCLENSVSAAELKVLLNTKNMSPVICPYVTYELSKGLLKNIAQGAKQFRFLLELDPQYLAPREKLYLREFDLIRNNNIADLADPSDREIIIARMKNHAVGRISPKLVREMRKRQFFLDNLNTIFYPTEEQRKRIARYKSFSDSINAILLKLQQGNLEFTKYIQQSILEITNGIELSGDDILKFSQNPSNYRIFRSLLRNAYYLTFLTNKNCNMPKEDRFTDGLIVIEYSYCDQFLSNDKKLLSTHIKEINPDIYPLDISEFLSTIIPSASTL